MAWITIEKADDIIKNTRNSAQWEALQDDEKTSLLERASTVLDGVPFKTDVTPIRVTRISDGFYADADGNAIADFEAPMNLLKACGYLAAWFIENPLDDITLLNEDINNSLTPFMANLPATVQQILWVYIIDEWKGVEYQVARADLERAAAKTAQVTRPGRNPARPIEYKDSEDGITTT